MEWVETTGRTVAEAREAALDQLGVDESDAEVVIVEEPKTALFGFRKSEARVRARVRPTSPRPKRQQRDRRGRGREGGSRSGSERPATAGAATAGGEGAGQELAPVGAERSETAGEGGSNSAGSAAGGSRNRRRRRGGRSGGGARAAGGVSGSGSDAEAEPDADATGSEAPDKTGTGRSSGRRKPRPGARRDAADTSRESEEEEMPIEEQAELAERFVRGVVECFGLAGATTSVRVDEALVEVAVDGEGLGLLIGPHGSTLSALQELTRTVVQRRGTEHGTRIVVDVAGYRAKRAAALVQFTKSVAAEVLASGRAHSLEPMSASDRKVVHDTVNEIEGVSTSSEGEEDRRHVVIHLSAPAADLPAEPAPAPVAESDVAATGHGEVDEHPLSAEDSDAG